MSLKELLENLATTLAKALNLLFPVVFQCNTKRLFESL